MGRLFKFLGIVVGALVALMIVAAIIVTVFFDPNDFRDDIAEKVKATTGRDLVIEGDVGLSVFPWIAIDVGKTSLGNAAGFGDVPMASFESAKLSVRLLPLILSRDISIGTAELESLAVNLAVDKSGRNNWDDLAQGDDTAAAEAGEAESGGALTLDIASINVSNTNLVYDNAQTGERITVSNVDMRSGQVASGQPIPFEGSLNFDMQPAAISGDIEIETVASFDTDAGSIGLQNLQIAGKVEGVTSVPATVGFVAPNFRINTEEQVVTAGELELYLLDIRVAANVEPFSYAGSVEPKAKIEIAEFSPRALMQQLDIEAPPTADPDALTKLSLAAAADVGEKAIVLRDLVLNLDDTKMTGLMQVPRSPDGRYRLVVTADNIDLNRYMAPAGEAAADATPEAVPIEIPVDLIRPLNATAKFEFAEILMGDIPLQNGEVSLTATNGAMRIHPVTATVFDGSYAGDIRINVAGDTPMLTFNEQIEGVSLGPLAQAMFETENITGTVNGTFKLTGRGSDTAEMQKTLNGTMSFELIDGEWQGTDVWHQLRSARALFKGEAAPKPRLPARTEFSSVTATGTVTDGIFRNDDLLAELPFMRVTGAGSVDLPQATVNYGLTARVLEKPEFVTGATDEELDEFTEAVIPLKISGPLSSPSIKPDVEKKIKEELLDKLLGGDKPAEGEEGEEGEGEKDVEDELKDALEGLFKR